MSTFEPGVISDDEHDRDTIELAQALIKLASITPVDAKDLPTASRTLDLLEARAEADGARTKRFPSQGGHDRWDYMVDNLYVEWQKGSADRFLCFIGHTDVVPVGSAADWSGEPFAGEIRDGFLYGRGATDMKGAVAAFFTAASRAVRECDNVRIGAIITTDEEWAAINGTRQVLRALSRQGIAPDAFLVGEPTSRDILGSHVKLGRRGSLVGWLNAQGIQGHTAYPGTFINPNRALSLAASILQTLQWDDGDDYMPATNFEIIATESGDFGASAIIPKRARLMWNLRFTPRQTPESLVARLENALRNPPQWAAGHPDAALLERVSVSANVDTVSQPYQGRPGGLLEAAQRAHAARLGVEATVDCSGGTTDGRFVHSYFPDAEILELGAAEHGGVVGYIYPADVDNPDDLPEAGNNPPGGMPEGYGSRGGMHQVDERIPLRDLINLSLLYTDTIMGYSGQGYSGQD